MKLTVLQILPRLDCGGVEQGTLDVAAELVRKNHRSIVVSSPGRLVQQLAKQGSEHFNLPVGEKSLLSIRLIPKLRKLFQEENIDIIHARSRFPAWLAYLAWSKLDPDNRPKFITTMHGPYTVNRYSKIMTAGERVIAISNYIKDYILTHYPDVDENKIDIVHRGISKARYPYQYQPSKTWMQTWATQHSELKNKFIVTLPARITRWKGHNDFIEIISKVISDGLNIHGLIVGAAAPGKERYLQELKTLISEKNMGKHLTFLGHRDDMKDIIAVSNVVLSLAKIPEAFGRTALEALSIGVPVIAYDHGGASEVLCEMFPKGKIAPLNIEAAISLLTQFYRSPPEVRDKYVFTLDKMLDKTLSIYNSFY